MSDCCSSLRVEIAALRAEIAKLKPVDENAIVKRSVIEANAFIMPKTEYLIASAIATLTFKLSVKFAAIEALAKAAAAAAATAGTAAAAAAAKVAALALTVAGIVMSIAALQVLGGRIDTLERAVDMLGNDVSRTLGLIFGVKQIAQKADVTAQKADATAQSAQTKAYSAETIAKDARSKADRAINTAQKAVDTASTAISKATAVQQTADKALNTANSASNKADRAISTATAAQQTADKALTTAQSVSSELSRLKPEVKEAKSLAQKAYETAIGLSSRVSSLEKFRAYVEGQIIPQVGQLQGRIEQVAGQIIPLKGSIAQVTATVGGLSATVGGLVQVIPPLAGAIPNLKGRIDKLEKAPPKVDTQTKIDIQQILKRLDALPALAVGAMIVAGLKPLSYAETVTAAASGVCRTTAPTGCLGSALNRTENSLFNRLQNLFNKLKEGALEKLIYAQTLANFAQLIEIQIKLGTQLKNGLSGAMNSVVSNQVAQTVTNYVILATTFHNALMLSNSIAQTLFSAIDNVLRTMGIKLVNADGIPIDVGTQVTNFSSFFMKRLFGADNYQALTETWAKANRIYQAGINVLNSVQNLTNSVLTGLEMTAGQVSKIGNALRASGEVLEKAYNWMNPQPKFNRITQTLENLQQGASTIQMITQAPLDIIEATTELTNATTELTNAIKEDGQENNKGKEAPEPIKLKADKEVEKIASAGKQMTDTDLDSEA